MWAADIAGEAAAFRNLSFAAARVESFEHETTKFAAETLKKKMQEFAEPHKDTGELYGDIEIEEVSLTMYDVGAFGNEYAAYVEWGAPPHMPNVERITEWAESHGFDPQGMIRHIELEGVRANPFVKPAVESTIGTFDIGGMHIVML